MAKPGGFVARAEAAELEDPILLAKLENQLRANTRALMPFVPRYPVLPLFNIMGYAKHWTDEIGWPTVRWVLQRVHGL